MSIEQNTQKAFVASMEHVMGAALHHSESHGFWDHDNASMDAEKIALTHGELSEALEGLRHGNPPDQHCPEFSSAEIEMADAVIRMMDHCARRGWRLPQAILAKMEFNSSRPHKHGKAF